MSRPESHSTFDPDSLRRRYRDERERRQRSDGVSQYLEVAGYFARFDVDPFSDPNYYREPLVDEVDVLVIGGGWGGLLVSAYLQDAGIERIRIVDKGGDFGGVWYWNRYPGVQCDIESYIYLPLLERMEYVPSEKYVHGPEIFAYAQALAKHLGLYDDACFHTAVTEMVWEEESLFWLVKTDRGDEIRSRFVIATSGPLSKPKLPGIPGIHTFQGHMFHTSRWDYEYTGGDCNGGLDRLIDKEVGIVGTGATAIQVVPHLGEAAKHLYVFQRTPSTVFERNNHRTDRGWAESLKPGWHSERLANFLSITSGGKPAEDLVDDAWTYIFSNLGRNGDIPKSDTLSPEEMALEAEITDFRLMEEIRARIDRMVDDSETAELLKPWYRLLCKRPCFSDDYLPTFNRPNVTLVDTRGRGIDVVTPAGAVVGDHEYKLDCLIFATGFEVGTEYIRRQGYDVIGRGGERLSEKYADGMRTFHGFYTRGFPNMLLMGVTQTGVVPNFPHMLMEQARHIAWVIERCGRDGIRGVEPTSEAEEAWAVTMSEGLEASLAFLAECTPGYVNNEGEVNSPHSQRARIYPPGPEEFFRLIDQWREDGGMTGLARVGGSSLGALPSSEQD